MDPVTGKRPIDVISNHNGLYEIFFRGKDRSEFARPAYRKANVSIGYVICIMPRSGSTFLTHLLRENRFYGYPDEWFNEDGIPAVISGKGIVNFDQYLDYLWKNYSSETGVFGVELSYPQLTCLREIIPLENVVGEDFKWFYLVRENIVAQAISLYIAKTTGHYHSYMEKSGDIAPEYDAEEIMNITGILLMQETAFERYFSARRITPVRISYESMMRDKCATVELFRNVLGAGPETEIIDSGVIKKISGDLNEKFEEKFRREEGVFIENILRKRASVMSMKRMSVMDTLRVSVEDVLRKYIPVMNMKRISVMNTLRTVWSYCKRCI